MQKRLSPRIAPPRSRPAQPFRSAFPLPATVRDASRPVSGWGRRTAPNVLPE